MTAQRNFQTLLQARLTEHRSKNSRYSVRAFARRLGLSPSATNEILKGQRKVSRKLVERVSDRLALGPNERSALLQDFPIKAKRRTVEETKKTDPVLRSLRLTADQFEMVSHWVHFAILSLVKVKSFKPSVPEASKRLGVPEKQVEAALSRLERLGLLKREGGKWIRTPKRIETTDEIANSSTKRSHIENLQLAEKSLSEDPMEIRDFSFLTLPADPRKLKKAKEMLREAQDRIAAFLDSGETTEVYRLTTILFPLTQTERNEK